MDRNVLRRIKLRDRIAGWVITVGGVAIIACVILILLLIGNVTLPLFQKPSATPLASINLASHPEQKQPLAVDIDEYLKTAVLFSAAGDFIFYPIAGNAPSDTIAVTAPSDPAATPVRAAVDAPLTFNITWSDGSLSQEQVRFTPRFDDNGKRTFQHRVRQNWSFAPPAEGAPLQSLARGGNAHRVRVDLFPDNSLKVTEILTEEDLFGNQRENEYVSFVEGVETEISALVLDQQGLALYAGTSDGSLLHWDLKDAGHPQLRDHVSALNGNHRITALALVLGDISLAVGDDQGNVSTWFPVRMDDDNPRKQLTRIHQLADHDSAVTAIIPSQRDKTLASIDADGYLHLDYMTSERHLLTLDNPAPVLQMSLAPRGNGLILLDDNQRLNLWSIHNPHPEISLKTLFGKVWYESYDEPDYTWQSSSASDDFEPKFSLTPLIFGTLKGTLYAMMFAIPMALYGAVYISQFSGSRTRQLVKPAIEVMAAIPSVVIGFLAALWFAPQLEKAVPALFLALILIPVALVLGVLLWQWLRRYQPLKTVERGYEFLAVIPVLLLAIAAAIILSPWVEQGLFAGDFKLWLFNTAAQRYDPRNSIVIAFALGFAVIPIIFTIAEDALSNVPASLKAASLALGASRWQTVWRVILPSASPGIFAGIMIGLGRAIGETMIVLMATGNTAIIDLSLFNGMRPLSSNIAVEIPEAPFGGSLYRVLFLSAVILFVLTFFLNTVAEIVRQRLRHKYGRF